MTSRTVDTSPLVYARVAGCLYLIIVSFGIFGEMVVRSSLIVPGDATRTANNIMASEWLFRIGFVGDSIVFLSDVVVSVVLYVLFRPVSKMLALVATAFRLTQTAMLGLNLLNHHVVLLLLSGAEYLTAFETGQRHALALLFLDVHAHGYDLGLLFFGLHCLVLGYLIVRSDYLPGILGILLMLASPVYLAGSLTRFLLPRYVALVSPMYVVPIVAEVSLGLWLLVKGIRMPPQTTRSRGEA